MQFSKRMDGLASAIFSQLDEKKNLLAALGREVINLSVGTPDLPPAPHIVEALQNAAHYMDNYKYALRDIPQLVDAVIYWYKNSYDVKLEPDEIMSVLGSQEGLAHISLVLTDPGDTILVPDPCYPIFGIGPSIACTNLYKMPLRQEKSFLIDLDKIEPSVAHSAKLMMVSYPNNPVTAAAPVEFYEKLVWFAKKYDIVVVHDNAYSTLVFDGRKGISFLSIPGAKDVGIEFNSLSKSHNMTGCRISFALGNSKIIKQFKILKSHLDYGIFLPVQHAAIAALTGPQDNVEATRLAYQKRRDVLIDGFNKIGWNIPKPSATMFVWAPIPANFKSSVDFTFELLERTGIIVVPGSSFGERGEGYVRIALVEPEEKLLRAVELVRQSSIL